MLKHAIVIRQVDPSVSFDQVGGLDHYIKALKEMVFLPLVYPELFERFHISPPRGVLFYGPPGAPIRRISFSAVAMYQTTFRMPVPPLHLRPVQGHDTLLACGRRNGNHP